MKKIKFKAILLLSLTSLLIIFSGCQDSNKAEGELFEGELFYKLVDFGPEVYITPSQDGRTLEQIYESKPVSELTDSQLQGKKEFEFIKEHGLLDLSYFNFAEHKSDKKFVKVYLSEEEYKKVELFKLSDLREADKKVNLSCYGTRLSDYAIKCNSIGKIEMIPGEPQWMK